MDRCDVENTLCQGAGFIKDYHFRIGQDFQIVSALHQDALAGSPANTPEERQGHGDDQGTRAGNHQENQGFLNPTGPVAHKQGRHQGQHRGANHHHGGIVPGKLGDEAFGPCLFAAGVFHQVQDLGHGGLAKHLGYPHPQQAALVDTAADYVITGTHLPRDALPSEGRGVHHGSALQHHTVQRDPLSSLYRDNIPYSHFLRIHLDKFPLPFHVGIIRTDVHQFGNGFSGSAHRIILEKLSYLVKQHDKHGFRIFPLAKKAGAKRPHCGQRHQKIFVEYLAVGNVANSPPQHIPANDEVGREKQQKAPYPLIGDQHSGNEQHRTDSDPNQHGLFFFSHHSQILLSRIAAEAADSKNCRSLGDVFHPLVENCAHVVICQGVKHVKQGFFRGHCLVHALHDLLVGENERPLGIGFCLSHFTTSFHMSDCSYIRYAVFFCLSRGFPPLFRKSSRQETQRGAAAKPAAPFPIFSYKAAYWLSSHSTACSNPSSERGYWRSCFSCARSKHRSSVQE